MSGDALQPLSQEKHSFLKLADRKLSVVENILNKIAAYTVFAVMLVTTAQILSRTVGFPVPGFLEVSEQAIAVFAFLGAAYGQRLGAHIRMELFVGTLKGRAKWMVELFTTLVSMCVILILVFYSFRFFSDAYSIGDTTLDYGFPTWPSKLLVPIAFSIWFLRLLVEFFGFLRLSINPILEPIAIPVVKSAADAAKEEMTEVFGREHSASDNTKSSGEQSTGK